MDYFGLLDSQGALDKRLHAYGDDWADERLKGTIKRARFVKPLLAHITSPVADFHSKTETQNGLSNPKLLSQALYGHDVFIFESHKDWALAQRVNDGYVGYIQKHCFKQEQANPTHMVLAPRTFLYQEADLKSPKTATLSMGSKLHITGQKTTRGTDYLILNTGESIIARHVMEIGQWQKDPVSIAETLLYTPYLWGGDSGFGIDCSGLVHLTAMVCGQITLRDSDMQAQTLGQPLENDLNALQRGDLIFWQGHVGLMCDQHTLIHANGHTMDVRKEGLKKAIERIGYLYGAPTQLRRMV